MSNIIYRHFQPGDEKQLAELFTRAFQTNKVGITRTPKVLYWRYMQSPNFEPNMIQIAEDRDKRLIVGAVYVHFIEEIPFNDKVYKVGEINDVSCHPDYVKKGIATNLMNLAIDYMKKKECDISMLNAGQNSIARIKMYLKLGYEDLEKKYNFVQCPNFANLFINMPIFATLFFPFYNIFYFVRILKRIKFRFNKLFKSFSYEIVYNKSHFRYMEAANRILSKNYTGFPPYTKEKLIWARIKIPSKRFIPTYILIKKENKIVGGAVLTHQNLYSFKYGFKIRFGIVHEIFLDKEVFNNDKNQISSGFQYLIDKVMKAAARRYLGSIIIQSSSKNNDLNCALRKLFFLKMLDESMMIKYINKKDKIPKSLKPLFLPTYITIGYP